MKVFAKSDIGKARDMNQDYYYVSTPEDNIKLFILADGMGGYNGGEIASKLATTSVKSYISNNFYKIEHDKESILSLIKNAVEYANMIVYEKSKEIKELEQIIIDFAELEEYIDQPVRTYSSGMKARLGFSINVNIKPEILIVDEALSVGDESFKKKCIKKIKEIILKENVTLLFVTHSTSVAKEFCSRGIVMKQGKIIYDGEIKNAIDNYNKTIK